MFKYTIVICTVFACALAKPALLAAPFAAPLAVAAPVVTTSTSAQYSAVNHHAVAAPLVAAAPAAYVAAPAAYAAAPAAYAAAPAAYAAAPLLSSYAYANSWNLPYSAATYVI